MNYQGIQINEPIASHGLAQTLKVAHYRVNLPNTVAGDTIDFGLLPHFSVPLSASMYAEGTFTGDISIDGAAVFLAQATGSNTVVRSSGSAVYGRSVGMEPVRVTGKATASGTVGRLDLFIMYDVDDPSSEEAQASAFPAGFLSLNLGVLSLDGGILSLRMS